MSLLNWVCAFAYAGGFLFAVTLTSTTAIGAPKADAGIKRQIDLELEEVEGASSYEIELHSKNSGKDQTFKMTVPRWKANIRTGEYGLRMRSYDARGVPGSWSESVPFLVKLPGPGLLAPTAGAKVKTNEGDTFETVFKWQSVSGAQKYRIEITPVQVSGTTPAAAVTEGASGEEVANAPAPAAPPADAAMTYSPIAGAEKIVETFSESTGKVKLPVGQSYAWTVTPIARAKEEGETQEPAIFTLVGKPLATPAIEKPEDIWVEKIKWEAPEHATEFTYLLQRKDEKGKWARVEFKENFKGTEVPFPTTYPGGSYRLAVKAQTRSREASKTSRVEFEVFSGDRSPAAVEESKLRYSLEKPTPWYFVASYLLTNVNYSGLHAEAGGRTIGYNALGGTGRLGLGYIHPKKNNGYLGLVDLSGFTVAGQNVTYASGEFHYLRRYSWGRNMLRPSTGLFYKELIETQSPFAEPNKFEHQKLSFAGPHIGFDFWRPFTSKLGFQINARIYYGFLGLTTPNGRDQTAEMSYQMGVMGSYKIRPNITGFLGWAHRLDKASYEATPFNATTSFAAPGAQQTVQIEGDYLNLLLEWGF